MPNGYTRSSVNGGDPDNNIKLDNNGQVLAGNEIRGLAITLTTGNEPEGSNANTNNSYDFGLRSILYARGVSPIPNSINGNGNSVPEAGPYPGKDEFFITVNPNPFIDYLKIHIRSSDNETRADIRILNATGSVILMQKASASTNVRVDAKKLPRGLYFVEVTQGDKRKVFKVVKAVD